MGLAEDHVDWFLGALRKPLIDAFEHGYKHGKEDASKCRQDAKSACGCVLMDKEGERVTEYPKDAQWRNDGSEGWKSDVTTSKEVQERWKETEERWGMEEK